MLETKHIKEKIAVEAYTKVYIDEKYLGWMKHYKTSSPYSWCFYSAYGTHMPSLNNKTREGLLADIEAAYREL